MAPLGSIGSLTRCFSRPATRKRASSSSPPRWVFLAPLLPCIHVPSLTSVPQELDGVPAEVISGYPKEGDKYRVTYKTPDITPVLCVPSFPHSLNPCPDFSLPQQIRQTLFYPSCGPARLRIQDVIQHAPPLPHHFAPTRGGCAPFV